MGWCEACWAHGRRTREPVDETSEVHAVLLAGSHGGYEGTASEGACYSRGRRNKFRGQTCSGSLMWKWNVCPQVDGSFEWLGGTASCAGARGAVCRPAWVPPPARPVTALGPGSGGCRLGTRLYGVPLEAPPPEGAAGGGAACAPGLGRLLGEGEAEGSKEEFFPSERDFSCEETS